MTLSTQKDPWRESPQGMRADTQSFCHRPGQKRDTAETSFALDESDTRAHQTRKSSIPWAAGCESEVQRRGVSSGHKHQLSAWKGIYRAEFEWVHLGSEAGKRKEEAWTSQYSAVSSERWNRRRITKRPGEWGLQLQKVRWLGRGVIYSIRFKCCW